MSSARCTAIISRAGAEVITANTFATSPLLFNAVQRDRDIRSLDRVAVRLAREAVEEAAGGAPIAIAGSFSTMRPVVARSDRTAKSKEWTLKEAEPLLHAKAEALAEAGCDLIIMEMMRDVDYSLWATEAAVATGLPVWVGVSVERRDDRRLAGFGRPEWIIEDIVATLMATGAKVCLVMHTAIDDTADALALEQIQLGGAGRRLSRVRPLQDAELGSSSSVPSDGVRRALPALAADGRDPVGRLLRHRSGAHCGALQGNQGKERCRSTPIAVHACAAPSASRSGGSCGR